MKRTLIAHHDMTPSEAFQSVLSEWGYRVVTAGPEQDVARFFDLSEDLFCIASTQGFLLRVNQRYEQLLGYPVAELYTRPFFDFVHPDDVPSVRIQVEALSAGDRVINFRCRLRDRLGEDHWIEWNARSLPQEGTIYAVGRDLSQRLQIEGELLVREQRERAILDNTPSVVYIKGTDGRYQFINRRYAELFALGQEAVIGMSDGDIFPGDYAEAFQKNDRHVADSRETITVEEIARHEDGDHTYVSVKFPLFDANGDVSAIAGISTDLTEQLLARKTEEEFRLGRAFQKKLYPESAPSIRGLDVAGAAIPATQMCGDYYDFVQLGPEHLAVCIGDVSGHGLGPALEMVQVRTACRVLLQQGADLPAAFGELNQILSDSLPEGEFVSLLIAVLDRRTGTTRYVGAGHEAFLIRADGSVARLESTNCVLGIDPSHSFVDTVSVEIQPGDLMFFFTDGLSEAMDRSGNMYDRARAIETVSRHRQDSSDAILMNVFASVFEFAEGRNITDDISAVVVKVVA
jgi:PAS domain S-box-containing protein